MKLLLSKDVKGVNRETNETRLHAKAGDVLFVLLISKTYYTCDSLYYPNQEIAVFNNQIDKVIEEKNDLSNNEEQIFSSESSISGDYNTSNDREDIEKEYYSY